MTDARYGDQVGRAEISGRPQPPNATGSRVACDQINPNGTHRCTYEAGHDGRHSWQGADGYGRMTPDRAATICAVADALDAWNRGHGQTLSAEECLSIATDAVDLVIGIAEARAARMADDE